MNHLTVDNHQMNSPCLSLKTSSGETILTEFTSHYGDMLSLVLDNEPSDEEELLLDYDNANCLQARR